MCRYIPSVSSVWNIVVASSVKPIWWESSQKHLHTPTHQSAAVIHCVSKKVPTFKLSVTMSNLNRFSKFLHCWKTCEICYKNRGHYPPHLRHVATLPWQIENSNFLQMFSRCGKNVNKLHFKCTDFNSSMHMTVCWVYSCVFMIILSLSLITMLIVEKHCCDKYLVLQIDLNVKQVKEQWHETFFLQSV